MENINAVQNELSANVAELFRLYFEDADNWSGTPMVGGNVTLLGEREDRGLLAHLKTAGLVKTFKEEGCVFLSFTPKGFDYAKAQGFE